MSGQGIKGSATLKKGERLLLELKQVDAVLLSPSLGCPALVRRHDDGTAFLEMVVLSKSKVLTPAQVAFHVRLVPWSEKDRPARYRQRKLKLFDTFFTDVVLPVPPDRMVKVSKCHTWNRPSLSRAIQGYIKSRVDSITHVFKEKGLQYTLRTQLSDYGGIEASSPLNTMVSMYHPVYVSSKKDFTIGHVTDIHLDTRMEIYSQSEASVIEVKENCDMNLTRYECALAFGPGYNKHLNFVKDAIEHIECALWYSFFINPFADYVADLGRQSLFMVDWGCKADIVKSAKNGSGTLHHAIHIFKSKMDYGEMVETDKGEVYKETKSQPFPIRNASIYHAWLKVAHNTTKILFMHPTAVCPKDDVSEWEIENLHTWTSPQLHYGGFDGNRYSFLKDVEHGRLHLVVTGHSHRNMAMEVNCDHPEKVRILSAGETLKTGFRNAKNIVLVSSSAGPYPKYLMSAAIKKSIAIFVFVLITIACSSPTPGQSGGSMDNEALKLLKKRKKIQ